jgi:hypothetical protein
MVYVFSTTFKQYSTRFEDGCEMHVPSKIVVEADDMSAARRLAEAVLADRIKYDLKHTATPSASLREWMEKYSPELEDCSAGTAFFIEGDDLLD